MSEAQVWKPTQAIIDSANITRLMNALGVSEVKSLQQWANKNYADFWQIMVKELSIVFKQPADQVCDLSGGIETPSWFKGSLLNIVDSCFNADPSQTAIVSKEGKTLTFGELRTLVNRIANGLIAQGFKAGDVIGLIMPMNALACAIYLAIIKIGGVVTSVPDSFSMEEMSVRFSIAKVIAVFTQNSTQWGGKTIPLYEKVAKLGLKTILITGGEEVEFTKTTLGWDQFLSDNADFESIGCEPMSPCHILFSSGTTGTPKAIPWNHTTPIKAASDAFLHQNIKQGDLLAWPTNLGWMMGPWLIFAAFINRAAIALYDDVPKDRAFGEFIQQSKVTMLGVVPTLVATWRQSRCMEGLDFSAIKVFSSTGECSNSDDMWYLMNLAGVKPVIEYCGGTEIGGAYISSTVVQPNYPSLFSTPTLSLDIKILDEHGNESNVGEVAIVPPSIGLSTRLLNADHHQIYFANMPAGLRRHGDEIEHLANGYYCVLGRSDDTMNLGGIKISSAELERAIVGVPDIFETAAIAVPPQNNGPSLLVIYAATDKPLDVQTIKKEMQFRINKNLNPLFKIHDVVFCKELPKTASNKIMRRVLRKKYEVS